MPGYTKAQLVEMEVATAEYAWCRKCRLYWHKRGIRTHKHVGGAKVTVNFHIPPTPKPKKGDVVILHPAYENFLNFLVDGAIKQWQEEQLGAAASMTPPGGQVPARRRRQKKEAIYKKPDYDVYTVEDALAKLGMTREEIMAEFDEVMRRFESTLSRPGATSGTPKVKD